MMRYIFLIILCFSAMEGALTTTSAWSIGSLSLGLSKGEVEALGIDLTSLAEEDTAIFGTIQAGHLDEHTDFAFQDGTLCLVIGRELEFNGESLLCFGTTKDVALETLLKILGPENVEATERDIVCKLSSIDFLKVSLNYGLVIYFEIIRRRDLRSSPQVKKIDHIEGS